VYDPTRLTIANQMLSLVGSIQPDPLSSIHMPDHSIQLTTATKERPKKVAVPEPIIQDTEIPDAADDSDEEDTFQHLGRLGDEAIAREAAQRIKAEEAAKSDKKRKRKDAKETIAAGDEDAQPEKKKKKKKAS
jgi:DNA-directed RNA polymerase I subunit RPA43